MSRKLNPKTRLHVEALEERCLMTASAGASALLPVQKSQQPSSVVVQAAPAAQSTMNILGLDGNATGLLVRSHDLVSGMRLNHNETMVRDARQAKQCSR
ncbi:MAG: hypothetical protein FJ271_22625 [Planctomycetes bacterium]|nr:hypothetical protein [Planctomycetota bacterium]